MHDSDSRRFGATTAGPSQLDGTSLLSLTQPEKQSTQRELEENVVERERRAAHSPEYFVMLGMYVFHLQSLLVCSQVICEQKGK